MVVVAVQLVFHIPHCHSLKDKRATIRPAADRVLQRLKVRVAEVGAQDLWQRAALGFAVTSPDRATAEGLAERVERELESIGGRVIARDREVFHLGRDPESTQLGDDDSWLRDFEASMLEKS